MRETPALNVECRKGAVLALWLQIVSIMPHRRAWHEKRATRRPPERVKSSMTGTAPAYQRDTLPTPTTSRFTGMSSARKIFDTEDRVMLLPFSKREI